MLETPLFGHFQSENRRLAFIAPAPYHMLVRTCVIGGIAAAIYGAFGPVLGLESAMPGWWLMVGVLVALAGVLAALSLQSIVFDLRDGMYRRRQGPGVLPTTTFGKITELDALVLIAEPNSRMINGGVTYHLVLHWKGQRQPPMVVQQDTRAIPMGQPLNLGAQALLHQGMRYAQALGLPFYDNSHFASPCPVPIWR